MAAKRTLNLVSAVLALMIMVLLVWDTSYAAFTAQTEESVDVVGAEIDLTDDDQVTTNFTGIVLGPTQSHSECVVVTYDGTDGWNPTLTAVSVDPTRVTGSNPFGNNLTLVVQRAADCSAASPTGPVVYNGTIDGTAVTTGWTPSADLDSRGFWVTVTLDGAAPDSAQGLTASFDLTWTVATN